MHPLKLYNLSILIIFSVKPYLFSILRYLTQLISTLQSRTVKRLNISQIPSSYYSKDPIIKNDEFIKFSKYKQN
jgi:hypothetical protein